MLLLLIAGLLAFAGVRKSEQLLHQVHKILLFLSL
jgi:hypothetical protein